MVHFLSVANNFHTDVSDTKFNEFTIYIMRIFPLLRIRVGLVVTPSTRPVAKRLVIASTSAESRKIFILIIVGNVPIGTTGFEPATSRSQSECSTKLKHVPWRKGWDLNPRMLSHRQFSRLMQSTTLPPFLGLELFFQIIIQTVVLCQHIITVNVLAIQVNP